MLRVPLVTILAREMRLKFFEVDQRLEMLRVALVTILARKMRLKFFWSRPSFGDVASAPSHHYWCEKCDRKFFQVDQALEMLRVPLVTILAREMRLKFFQVDQRLEMLRVALVTILAREMRLNFFEVDQPLGMLRVPLVTILAREMRLIFRSRPTFGDVASAASHDIGARNAIESFFSTTSRAKVPIERFRAGHFTCKNTDWEKWREPIRKVEPETTDWALHTRIPVRIEPSHFLTAAECWSIAGSEDTQSWNFYFSVSFFFLSFFPFVSGRWPDLGVLPRLQTCFQFIYLLIYLFIFFACHATVVVVVVVVVVVTGFVLKDSSPPWRMFASK